MADVERHTPCSAARGESWSDRLRARATQIKMESVALYLVCRDPRTPWYAKTLAFLVVAYLLSPVDLIPDFIPVLGQLDDLIIVPLGAALVIRITPPEIMNDCRGRARQLVPPRRWAVGIVVATWLLFALLVVGVAAR